MEQTTITRADRKIELAKLSVNRHALIEAFQHATSGQAPMGASTWDLIREILDAEFPPPPPTPSVLNHWQRTRERLQGVS